MGEPEILALYSGAERMTVFIFSFGFFALAMLGLAIGILAGKPFLRRGCGAAEGEAACPDCGCDVAGSRKAPPLKVRRGA